MFVYKTNQSKTIAKHVRLTCEYFDHDPACGLKLACTMWTNKTRRIDTWIRRCFILIPLLKYHPTYCIPILAWNIHKQTGYLWPLYVVTTQHTGYFHEVWPVSKFACVSSIYIQSMLSEQRTVTLYKRGHNEVVIIPFPVFLLYLLERLLSGDIISLIATTVAVIQLSPFDLLRKAERNL